MLVGEGVSWNLITVPFGYVLRKPTNCPVKLVPGKGWWLGRLEDSSRFKRDDVQVLC